MLKKLYKTHHCKINLAEGQSLARILLSLLAMVPENHFNVRKMYAKDHFGLFSVSNTIFGNMFLSSFEQFCLRSAVYALR